MKPSGPIWLVHSWGVEDQIVAGLKAWAAFGGKSVAILDYATNLTDRRIEDLRANCLATGLKFYPGSLFTGGSGFPRTELLDPASWKRHLDAAKALKCTHYFLDLEQWCGMNACEGYTEGECFAIAAMIGQWAREMLALGFIPCIYGPWSIRTGLSMFMKFYRHYLALLPREACLVEYLDVGITLLDHPAPGQLVPMWMHPPTVSPVQFKAAASGYAALERSAYYGSPNSIVPALQAQPATA